MPDSKTAPRPYKTSWANRFSTWVGELTGSSLVYYLGLWAGLTLLQILALWAEGADPVETFQVPQAFLAGAAAFMAGMFRYFNLRAARALAIIQPALTLDDEGYQALEFRLTRLPLGRPLLAAALSVAILFMNETIVGMYWPELLRPYAFSSSVFRGTYYLCWGFFGIFVYQSLHRLKWINQIYSQHTRINLLFKSPLYALSNLAALTAGSITVLPLGFLISSNLTDISLLDPATIITVVLIQVVAFLSFLWPQLGIQRLQRAEKDRLLEEALQRYQKLFQELHKRIDEGQFDSSPNLTDMIITLEKEIAKIEGIPIWPWEPETMRWLLTALVLPIGFMILQLILQRAFG
jgi:hypothetical protein